MLVCVGFLIEHKEIVIPNSFDMLEAQINEKATDQRIFRFLDIIYLVYYFKKVLQYTLFHFSFNISYFIFQLKNSLLLYMVNSTNNI